MEEFTPEQLASLTKERSRNETNKRFVLSQEEFLRQRLQVIKSEIDEIQKEHPEVLSLCLFGSMVKGTAHEGSDIDGFLYIDSEMIAKNENTPKEQIIKPSTTSDQAYLTKEVANKYLAEFRDGIKNKTGLEDKDVKDIKARLISEKIIDDEIKALLEFYKNKEKYDADIDKWIENKPSQGSDIDELLLYEKSRPVVPEHLSTSLRGMFHLDIGGGIRKYRKIFIDKLAQLGDGGEKIWSDTIRGTEMLENNLSTDSTKHYPRTLAEALVVYTS